MVALTRQESWGRGGIPVKRGSVLAATPLMIVPVIVYNLFALTLRGGLKSLDAYEGLTHPLLKLTTVRGGAWPISVNDLLLAVGLVVLFLELVKSTNSRRLTLINHWLSILVFAVCLAEMLFAPACATSTFFLMMQMVLLDVLVGFVVRTPAIRRDKDI
jgi:hypothetical protein